MRGEKNDRGGGAIKAPPPNGIRVDNWSKPKFWTKVQWPLTLIFDASLMNAVPGESVALKTQVVEILLYEKSTLPTKLHYEWRFLDEGMARKSILS